MIIENHKGDTCKYVLITCQEGYCSDCNIYYQSIESQREEKEEFVFKNLATNESKELVLLAR